MGRHDFRGLAKLSPPAALVPGLVFIHSCSVDCRFFAFLSEPFGLWIAALAVGAMLLNGVIMLVERGFSKLMALPHVLIWIPMLGLVLWLLAQDIAPAYRIYLLILLAVDAVSLVFDAIDTRRWLSGEREIA